VASVALLPFIISEVSFFPGNFARAIFFRVIVEVMLVAFVGLIFIDKKYFPPINLITMLIGAWWGTLAISTLLSPQPLFAFWGSVERMEGFFTLSHYFIFFFILVGSFKDRLKWQIIFNAGIMGSIIMAGISLLQRLEIGFTSPILVGRVLPRATGTLESPLFLSSYLLFFIFLSLTLFVENLKKRIALLYATALVFQILALFATDTRSGQLALIVGTIWFIVLLPIRHKVVTRAKIAVAGSMLGGVVLFAILASQDALMSVVERLPLVPRLLFYATDITSFVNSLDQRLDVWNIAWQGFLSRPFFGYGPEQFTYVMDGLFPAYLNIYFQQQWLNKSLNILLDTLIFSGIVGLGILVTIFGVLFWKLVVTPPKNKLFAHGIFVIFIAYITQALANLDHTLSYILLFLFLAFAVYLIGPRTRFSITSIHFFKGNDHSKGLFLTIMGVTSLFLLGSIYFLNVQPLLANRHLQMTTYLATKEVEKGNEGSLRIATNYFNKHASSVLRSSNIISLDNSLSQVIITLDDITTLSAQEYPEETKKILENTIALIEKEAHLKPSFSKPQFFLGKFYTKLSQFDKAAIEKANAHFENATTLSPNRYMFWIEWAKADPLLNNGARAKEHGLRALTLIETNEAYFWTGIGYIFAEQAKFANPYLEKLTTPSAYQYLENVYRLTKNFDILIKDFYPKRIQEEPRNLQWRASLAVTHYELGNTQKACAVIQDLLSEPDIDEASRQSGESFLLQLDC